jgi:hypothetical protein
LHRSNPCSGIGGDVKTLDEPSTAEDVHRRDALRMFSLFGEGSPSTSGAPAPAPSPSSGVEPVPIRGDPNRSLPGALEYHVTAGAEVHRRVRHGHRWRHPAPVQALRHVPGAVRRLLRPVRIVVAGLPVERLLWTQVQSWLENERHVPGQRGIRDGHAHALAVHHHRELPAFACLEDGLQTVDSSPGILDLSRNSHSLASRAPNSLFTVAFSYFLPSS